MATLSDYGVRGMGGEFLQPMQKHKWRVTFNGLGRLVSTEALTISAITCDLPKQNMEEVQIDRYNSRGYIFGKNTFEPVNITFEADIGGRVAAALRDQWEVQQKVIGMQSAPRMPSATAAGPAKFSLTQELLDGDDGVLQAWYLEGSWLRDIDWGDLDYASSETLKITVTVRFDHARTDIIGADGLGIGGYAPVI
jgi:hypothetical protein